MNKIQSELNQLYSEYLDVIFSKSELVEKILNFNISSPLFVDVDIETGNYLNSDYKVLYVGKETNCWYNMQERERDGLLSSITQKKEYLTKLLNLYYTFNLGQHYNTAIITFYRILLNKLKGTHGNVGILWTNLLRHDYFRNGRSSNNGKVPWEVEQQISYNRNFIFRKEIEILKPDAIVFVTGPNYDYILENSYEGIEKKPVENYLIREACTMKHPILPGKCIRVTHPNSHKFMGKEHRWNLADMIIKTISV